MSTSDVIPFAFKLTHPVLYAQTIVVQATDYAAAAAFAQAHCTDTLWSISKATNMQTGTVVSNG
jgi:hypothetical protein